MWITLASEEISDQLRGINAELNSQCDLIAADERFRLFDKSRFESMKDHPDMIYDLMKSLVDAGMREHLQ